MNLDKQKNALLALQADNAAKLEELRHRSGDTGFYEETGTESDIPTHDADAGTALFERERDQSFSLEYQGIADSIAHALGKIEAGTYTTCDRCGQPIPADRLAALPYAVMCINCQEIEEGL